MKKSRRLFAFPQIRSIENWRSPGSRHLDLRAVRAIGLDETACKRVHHYVTVFIGMARRKEFLLFVAPGRSKDTLRQFAAFLREHGAKPGQILEVVCNMVPAFLRSVDQYLPGASITIDRFHVVQIFTRSVDEVRKLEGEQKPLPNRQCGAQPRRPPGSPDGPFLRSTCNDRELLTRPGIHWNAD